MEDDYTPEGNSGRSGRVKPSLAHLYYMLTACNGFRIYYKSKSAFFFFLPHLRLVFLQMQDKELVAVQTSRSFDLYCHTNFCCFISGMSLIAWQFYQPSAGFFFFVFCFLCNGMDHYWIRERDEAKITHSASSSFYWHECFYRIPTDF